MKRWRIFLKENGGIFMTIWGIKKKTNRNFYRCPPDLAEIQKVAPVLTKMDEGNSARVLF